MRPIKNNIIVKRNNYKKTAGGLIIDQRATEKIIAEVVAVGDGTRTNPMSIKVGDMVSIRKDVGQEIDYEGLKLLHLNEAHVIAVL